MKPQQQDAQSTYGQRYAHVWELPLPDPTADAVWPNSGGGAGGSFVGYNASDASSDQPDSTTRQCYGNNTAARNVYDVAFEGDYNTAARHMSNPL